MGRVRWARIVRCGVTRRGPTDHGAADRRTTGRGVARPGTAERRAAPSADYRGTVPPSTSDDADLRPTSDSARPDGTPPASDGAATVRVRLDLAYDGTDFAGWATQPGLRTVQGTLESALGTVLRCPDPRLTVAGRTDAGVHARGQVAHLDLPGEVWRAVRGRMDSPPGDALVRRLAGVLPADVVVHRATVASAGFDARFGALHRRYTYRLADRPELVDPLRRAHVVRQRLPLDAGAMHEAATALVGRHDFAAFCKAREGATTIRTLQVLDVVRAVEGLDAGLVVATVQADAFCHSMVRAVVGALVAVGEGRHPVTRPAELLAGRRRAGGAAVAPAHGLTLEEVVYPPDGELAARASVTRARRAADDVDRLTAARPAEGPVAKGPVLGGSGVEATAPDSASDGR